MKLVVFISLFICFGLNSCTNIKPLDGKDNTTQAKTEPVDQTQKSQEIKTTKTEEPPKKVDIVKTEIPKEIPKNTEKVAKYCQKLDKYFKKYKWGKSECESFYWHHVRDSYWGNPIIWHVFGDEEAHKEKHTNTTLILCGVHGDEITPVKFCFDILNDLKAHPEVYGDNLVVVAPLVTPDSFLKKYPTRTNARGVDVNRNFPTKDWNKNAIRLWKNRYKSDKRRYPGNAPRSEHETVFQMNLIKRYKPQKIISVHAPLTLIDYDGPEEHRHIGAKQLLIQMSDKAGKYKINNYPFFTGSLGNWAGNERKIPTYTLELPNSDWTKTKKFFNTFRTAIHHAIDHDLHIEVKDKVTDKSNPNGPVL